MLNQTKVTHVSGATRKTILVDEKNSTAVSCMIANTGVEAGEGGRKIVKAGTPLAGDLKSRGVAFTVAKSAENLAGIAMHDVDVTDGTANGAVLIFGTVDWSKLDATVQTALSAEIAAGLKMIQFIA